MLNSIPLNEDEEMRKSELKDMSSKQLRDLVAAANEQLAERVHEERESAREKVKAIADDLGISIQELLGVKNGKAKTPSGRTPAKPKYRSKKDPSLAWTGKGRMAAWLVEEVEASGKDKEHFLIKD